MTDQPLENMDALQRERERDADLLEHEDDAEDESPPAEGEQQD